MYVNEVGHDKRNKQNVCALDKDDRTVHYFLCIEDPMKRGDKVELLVDYFDIYEEMRERKGYGLANLKGVKSDEDLATSLERNFADRSAMELTIKDLNVGELFVMLDWLEPIRSELMRTIKPSSHQQFSFSPPASAIPPSLLYLGILVVSFRF